MDYYVYCTSGGPRWSSNVNPSTPTGDTTQQLSFSAYRYVISTDSRIICYKKHVAAYGATGTCFYFLSNHPVNVINTNASVQWFNDNSTVWRSDDVDMQNLMPLNIPDFFNDTKLEIHLLGSVRGGKEYRDGINIPAVMVSSPITNDPNTTGKYIGFNDAVYTEDSLEFKKYTGTDIGGVRSFIPPPWQYSSNYSTDFNNALDIALWLNGQSTLQYLDKNVFFDGYPLILDMYITEDLDQAKDYLDTGKIPDDAEKNESEGGKPKPPEPPRPDKDDDNIEQTPGTTHTPSQTAYSINGVNVYHISRSKLSEFIYWFWHNMVDDWAGTVINTITGLYGNMSECVISIKKIFTPSSLLYSTFSTSPYIKIGRYQYDTGAAGCDIISGGALSQTEVGTYYFAPHYDNFVDYSPYTAISVYLPYVGVVPLNTDLCVGRTMSVYAVADIHTMEISYNLKIDGALVGTYKGTCGMTVPFSLDNGMDIISNGIKAYGGAVLTKNPALIMSNLAAPIDQNTQSSTNLSMYDPGKCHVIIQRSRYKNPESYGNKTGYRLEKYCKLAEINGFTVVDNPVLDGITATKSEKEQLKLLLQGGIYL